MPMRGAGRARRARPGSRRRPTTRRARGARPREALPGLARLPQAAGDGARARRRVVHARTPAARSRWSANRAAARARWRARSTMIETPTAGQLRLAGVDVAARRRGERRSALRRQVQMVFQNPFASLNPRKKIGQALEEPLAINTDAGARRARGSGRARCWRASACGPSTTQRYPHMFSGGQRQRIAIARALMLRAARSSSPTSRCRRSTSRSRRRCSTC